MLNCVSIRLLMFECCCDFYVKEGMCNFIMFSCNDNKTKFVPSCCKKLLVDQRGARLKSPMTSMRAPRYSNCNLVIIA